MLGGRTTTCKFFEGLTMGPCMAAASRASEGEVRQGKTK
jgi:hypothetical protein